MPSMRNERLVGLGAADADLREVSDAAALAHLDAGQVAQRIRRVADLAVLEVLARDDGDRSADLIGGHAAHVARGRCLAAL